MTRRNLILTVLAVVQVALIAFFLWPAGSNATVGKLIADFSPDQVTAVTIADSTRTVKLAKAGEQWVLPDAGDFAVNSVRVTELLTKVASIDTSRLVATNPSSQARLQVTTDNFVRKLEITTADGKSRTLFVGSSPNARATHIRLSDSDNVYLTGAVSTADVRTDTANWIDTVYLQTNADDIRSLTIQNQHGVLKFNKDEGSAWMLEGLSAGETLTDTEVTTLANRLTTVNLTEPLGKEEKPEYGTQTPTATVTIQVQPMAPISATAGVTTTAPLAPAGPAQTITLAIGAKNASDNSYVVKASSSDYFVKVGVFSLDGFVTKQRSDFVHTPALSSSSPVTATSEITATGAVSVTTGNTITTTTP